MQGTEVFVRAGIFNSVGWGIYLRLFTFDGKAFLLLFSMYIYVCVDDGFWWSADGCLWFADGLMR